MSETIDGVIFITVILSFFLIVMPVSVVVMTNRENQFFYFCRKRHAFAAIFTAAIVVHTMGRYVSAAFHIYQLLVLFSFYLWCTVNFPRVMKWRLKKFKKYQPRLN
ncbi:hypothetical protein BTA51_14070 [Hahella sp. CCB-MM4]|nr:hypothetical protein BTA51_14070 [Hahella sp. CCB-MM4]